MRILLLIVRHLFIRRKLRRLTAGPFQVSSTSSKVCSDDVQKRERRLDSQCNACTYPSTAIVLGQLLYGALKCDSTLRYIAGLEGICRENEFVELQGPCPAISTLCQAHRRRCNHLAGGLQNRSESPLRFQNFKR